MVLTTFGRGGGGGGGGGGKGARYILPKSLIFCSGRETVIAILKRLITDLIQYSQFSDEITEPLRIPNT